MEPSLLTRVFRRDLFALKAYLQLLSEPPQPPPSGSIPHLLSLAQAQNAILQAAHLPGFDLVATREAARILAEALSAAFASHIHDTMTETAPDRKTLLQGLPLLLFLHAFHPSKSQLLLTHAKRIPYLQGALASRLEDLVGNFARDPTDPAWFHLLVENLARVLTTAALLLHAVTPPAQEA